MDADGDHTGCDWNITSPQDAVRFGLFRYKDAGEELKAHSMPWCMSKSVYVWAFHDFELFRYVQSSPFFVCALKYKIERQL